MKVTIKLYPEQLARAQTMDLPYDGRREPDPYPCFNPNQAMRLDGDLLTYEGERCPFWQDGLAVKMGWVLTGVPYPQSSPDGTHDGYAGAVQAWRKQAIRAMKAARVTHYVTSDFRLKWWETLESYCQGGRASVHEALAYLERVAQSSWKGYVASQAPRFIALHDAAPLVGMPEAKRCAVYPAYLVWIARRIEAIQRQEA